MEDNRAVHQSLWSPLMVPVFRALWIASLVANLGVWMQNVSGVWLMTTLSPSPVLIALMQTATSLPVFLLALLSGALADIVDRRRLLMIGLAMMLMAVSILGVLTLIGATTPLLLLVLTFVLGLGTALNQPIWQAIMPGLVPREELSNAVTLGGVGFNIARAIGPALGGIIVAVIGPGAVFLLNAGMFLITLVVLIRWQSLRRSSAFPSERVVGALRAGLRYLRHAPPLQAVLVRMAVFISCGSALWALLPLVAGHDLNLGGLGYGIFLGCLGLGAIIGAMFLPRVRQRLPIDVLVASATLVYTVTTVALALLHLVSVLLVVLLVGGMAWMTLTSSFNVLTQLAVPRWVQARALGLYYLVFQGGTAFGSIVWGVVAARLGVSAALLCAAVGMVVGLATTLWWRLQASQGLDMTQVWAPWVEPHVLIEERPEDVPVLVTVEYRIDPTQAPSFLKAMRDLHRVRLRDGAIRGGIYVDPRDPERYVETFVIGSWDEHVRQHERMTMEDRTLEERVRAFHIGEMPPVATHLIYATETWVKGMQHSWSEHPTVGGVHEHLPQDIES
jgi:MFS family permease